MVARCGERTVIKILFAMVVFLLSACASQETANLTSAKQWEKYGLSVDQDAQARKDVFVGLWYDRQNARDGTQSMSLMNVMRDGTYSESWRNRLKDGRITVSEERGRWGVSGNIFFTIVIARSEGDGELIEVDQRDAYFYNAYIIDYANESENSIRHILTGDEFVSRRVNDKFTFPPFSM